MLFYLSFATDQKFLGAAFIEADDPMLAVVKAHLLKAIPEGIFQVLTVGLSGEAMEAVSLAMRDRLLTRQELMEHAATIGEGGMIRAEELFDADCFDGKKES